MVAPARLRDLPAPPPGRQGWPWTEECPPLPPARPDGRPWPRIGIVTPVYNQGQYLEETLRSVLLQGYPELEYVVVNDGSTDDSELVIRRYERWLSRWVTQPNQGQRAAINRGFEGLGGELQAYLNSDDLLLPGALERAALEIDPARGRHVVMGRSRFTDHEGRFTGVEHPAHFEGHARVLQVWKGHTIPQPSVFWTPQVWRECGPILEDAWVDYGLFARFSRRHRFHFVDQVLSTYRLHPESKTQVSGEQRRLDEVLAISRRYWGGPLRPLRWRLAASLALHRFGRRGRGLRLLRAAGERRRQGRPAAALLPGLGGLMLAPDVLFTLLLLPWLRERLPSVGRRLQERLTAGEDGPETLAFLERDEPWSDGWLGPRLRAVRETAGAARALRLTGGTDLRFMSGPLALRVRVDGQELPPRELPGSGGFTLELPLPAALPAGRHEVEVEATRYFVPHRYLGNGDRRPLSWHLGSLELLP